MGFVLYSSAFALITSANTYACYGVTFRTGIERVSVVDTFSVSTALLDIRSYRS